MPYQITFDGSMILTRFHGNVTTADLVAMAAELIALERQLPFVPHRLNDLRDIEDFAQFPAVSDLAEKRRMAVTPNKFRSAILVSSGLGYGYARMFQTLADGGHVEIEVFTDEAEARAWLAA